MRVVNITVPTGPKLKALSTGSNDDRYGGVRKHFATFQLRENLWWTCLIGVEPLGDIQQ